MDAQSPESWETIYREHRQALFAIAYSVLGCEQMAEDAIHEAFVSIYRTNQSPIEEVAYVFTSVRNSAIDMSRRTKRVRQIHETIFNGHIPPAIDSSADRPTLLDRERDLILRQAIDQLPSEQREVVILKTFADLTFEQIAMITATPTKTLATRYRRALARLEQQLKGKL